MKKLSQSVKFIDYFVHDILDFSILRKHDEKFTKDTKIFDIRDAIKEIMEIQEDKAEMKGITVHTIFRNFEGREGQHPTDAYYVKTDPKRLQQVLLNLYSNAIKFTDRDGEIKIITEMLEDENGSKLLLSVEDNGIGIKLKDQPQIFKQFSSIKDPKLNINTKGIGLGLVISKMIVEKFGGSIGFSSTYRMGSTFYYEFEVEEFCQHEHDLVLQESLNIPEVIDYQLIEDEATFNQYNCFKFIEDYAEMREAAAKRVLVVDDEEFCISTMKILLKMAGLKTDLQVDFCISGSEAYDCVCKALDAGLSYRLILTDFNMPGMDGMEATKLIRQKMSRNGV